jgi:hypothetical protein
MNTYMGNKDTVYLGTIVPAFTKENLALITKVGDIKRQYRCITYRALSRATHYFCPELNVSWTVDIS